MMMQKRRILVGMLAALAVLAGGMLLNHWAAEHPPASANVAEAEPEATATPTIEPTPPETDPAVIAEKLKEVTTYRNEEFGFVFQHPKYQLEPDGNLNELHASLFEPWSDTVPLHVDWTAGVTLMVVEKKANFSTLREYIDERDRLAEKRAKEYGEPACLNRRLTALHIDGHEALLTECVSEVMQETTLFIEVRDYVYNIFCPGHLSEGSQDVKIRQELQFVQTLIDTWTFSEKEQE